MLWWTGIFVGLAGSLHCVGMCGPIALALPGKFNTGWSHLLGRLLYNGGRVITYATLGTIAGIIGQGAAWAGWQQGLSISMGVLLLVVTLVNTFRGKSNLSWPLLDRALYKLKGLLSKSLRKQEKPSLFVIGLLNGLLPCGFVYLGLAGAMSMSSPLEAAGYMAAFGLGTFPLMLAFSLFGGFIRERLKGNMRPWLTGFAVVFSLLLIVRGLNLGIPYISPQVTPTGQVAECH